MGRKIGAGLIGLITAFILPLILINFSGNVNVYGFSVSPGGLNVLGENLVYFTGLRNLGLGDIGRGIGICGAIGLISGVCSTLLAYSVLNGLKKTR